jgi:hypothetical protein
MGLITNAAKSIGGRLVSGAKQAAPHVKKAGTAAGNWVAYGDTKGQQPVKRASAPKRKPARSGGSRGQTTTQRIEIHTYTHSPGQAPASKKRKRTTSRRDNGSLGDIWG